jgi:hypothetical protein
VTRGAVVAIGMTVIVLQEAEDGAGDEDEAGESTTTIGIAEAIMDENLIEEEDEMTTTTAVALDEMAATTRGTIAEVVGMGQTLAGLVMANRLQMQQNPMSNQLPRRYVFSHVICVFTMNFFFCQPVDERLEQARKVQQVRRLFLFCPSVTLQCCTIASRCSQTTSKWSCAWRRAKCPRAASVYATTSARAWVILSSACHLTAATATAILSRLYRTSGGQQ